MVPGFRHRGDRLRFGLRGAAVAGCRSGSRSIRPQDGRLLGDPVPEPRIGRHDVRRVPLAALPVFRGWAYDRRGGARARRIGFGVQLVCPPAGQGYGDRAHRRPPRRGPLAVDGSVLHPRDRLADGLERPRHRRMPDVRDSHAAFHASQTGRHGTPAGWRIFRP